MPPANALTRKVIQLEVFDERYPAELGGRTVQAVIARPTADQQRILDLLKVTL